MVSGHQESQAAPDSLNWPSTASGHWQSRLHQWRSTTSTHAPKAKEIPETADLSRNQGGDPLQCRVKISIALRCLLKNKQRGCWVGIDREQSSGRTACRYLQTVMGRCLQCCIPGTLCDTIQCHMPHMPSFGSFLPRTWVEETSGDHHGASPVHCPHPCLCSLPGKVIKN